MKKKFFFQVKILFKKIFLYSMKIYFYLESFYFHPQFFHVKKVHFCSMKKMRSVKFFIQ